VLATGLAAAKKDESINEKDLPVLAAQDRAVNLWQGIKDSKHLMESAPRGVNRLLWRVLVINKKLFIWRKQSSRILIFAYFDSSS